MSDMILLAMSFADEIDMQRMALTGKLGWALGLGAWAFVLNMSFGIINNSLKELAEKVIPEDADRINRIFQSRTYRIISWLLDKLARVKLPQQGKKLSESKP